MNNNYNPMTPAEDSLKKFQWSVHSIKRGSQLFKTLVSDHWSCAGAISPNKDNTTNINEFSLAFYWRKLKQSTPTHHSVASSPLFKFNPPSCCSTPAKVPEENIIIDLTEDSYQEDSDTEMTTDTFFNSFNNNKYD
tara:strand:- start:988 stop:1395 length:408 start_codon:yes stop_codon:yes gene_type:complete